MWSLFLLLEDFIFGNAGLETEIIRPTSARLAWKGQTHVQRSKYVHARVQPYQSVPETPNFRYLLI